MNTVLFASLAFAGIVPEMGTTGKIFPTLLAFFVVCTFYARLSTAFLWVLAFFAADRTYTVFPYTDHFLLTLGKMLTRSLAVPACLTDAVPEMGGSKPALRAFFTCIVCMHSQFTVRVIAAYAASTALAGTNHSNYAFIIASPQVGTGSDGEAAVAARFAAARRFRTVFRRMGAFALAYCAFVVRPDVVVHYIAIDALMLCFTFVYPIMRLICAVRTEVFCQSVTPP